MSRPESWPIARKFKLLERAIARRGGAKTPEPFASRAESQKTGRNRPIPATQRHFECRGQITLMAVIGQALFPGTPIAPRGIRCSSYAKTRQMAPRAGVAFIIRRVGCHHGKPRRHRRGLRVPFAQGLDVKRAALIRDNQVEGPPGAGI